jgi:hypothetical protein
LGDAVYNALMTHAPEAMRVLGQLIESEDTPTSVRADIGKFIYEQLHGKAAAKINLDAKIGPREAVASAIILDDGLPQGHLTIEGEWEDEEPDDL